MSEKTLRQRIARGEVEARRLGMALQTAPKSNRSTELPTASDQSRTIALLRKALSSERE